MPGLPPGAPAVVPAVGAGAVETVTVEAEAGVPTASLGVGTVAAAARPAASAATSTDASTTTVAPNLMDRHASSLGIASGSSRALTSERAAPPARGGGHAEEAALPLVY